MFEIKNFMENDDVRKVASLGAFSVLEYQRDLSVSPENAMNAYYCAEMNIRRRQIVCDLSKANVTVQSGAMQWMVGDVRATTGIKGVGDLLGKAVRSKITEKFGTNGVHPSFEGYMQIADAMYRNMVSFLRD